MTPPDHLNPRQRAFVEHYVSGKSLGRAYEAAGYAARGTVADNAGHRLSKQRLVAAAIQTARAELRAASRMTKEDALDYLCDVLRTPIGEIDPSHPLAQEYQSTEAGEKIKMPAKMDAMEKLAKMLGWYAPEEVVHSGDVMIVIGGDAE